MVPEQVPMVFRIILKANEMLRRRQFGGQDALNVEQIYAAL